MARRKGFIAAMAQYSREMERQYKPDFAHNLGGRRRSTGERPMVRQRMADETKSRFHRRPTWLQAP